MLGGGDKNKANSSAEHAFAQHVEEVHDFVLPGQFLLVLSGLGKLPLLLSRPRPCFSHTCCLGQRLRELIMHAPISWKSLMALCTEKLFLAKFSAILAVELLHTLSVCKCRNLWRCYDSEPAKEQ